MYLWSVSRSRIAEWYGPKGDQSWVFIGRTDVEAETPILWPPDAKSLLVWKDPDAGKDWEQEEKGMTEDKMVAWHHWQWTWVWVNSGSWWWDREAWRPAVHGLQRVRRDWATDLNWTEPREILFSVLSVHSQMITWVYLNAWVYLLCLTLLSE